MPTSAWHQLKSKHDIDVYSYLDLGSNKFVDWESVTLFYSALHLVDAYLVGTYGIQPSNHRLRNNYVNMYLRSIRLEYLFIYNLSKKSRYMATVSIQERDRAKVHFNSISTFFKAGLSV